jgi:predicted PurR-regulated permease PerM
VSNHAITYLVGACLGVFGLAIFCALVIAPAVVSYRRAHERIAAVILSLYVLAALLGLGILLGAVVVVEWPRVF